MIFVLTQTRAVCKKIATDKIQNKMLREARWHIGVSSSSKEMGFLNPKYPLPSESGGAVQLGRDVTPTTLVQIKLVGPFNW